ncbi:aquaporin [Caenimonas terrae]|uniref:Aquaporin n=1 Tax=Caenimonas terrae TaxID=696074 RepID=A0ABW0NH61_9BURK
MKHRLSPAVLAEFLGTAMLLCAVIGSGIMAERLSGGNVAIALLANTLVTMFALYVLIETLGPVSGAHFNPLVTLVLAARGSFAPADRKLAVAAFIGAQLLGAVAGAWLAHLMFELPLLQWSSKLRAGPGQWLAEAVATAGLVLVILRAPAGKGAALVACYIGAAYWFTASTSFANPAAVLGRMMSDSFAGIAPASAIGFVAAQAAGAVVGVLAAAGLQPSNP